MKAQKVLQVPKEIKILLLGESNVGKTSIFKRFIFNKFDKNQGSTIGVDFESKVFKYKNNDYQIRLFDTAGQERFRSITQGYYHMGEGFFIVFDLNNQKSLEAIIKWIESIKENSENPKFIILGNKDDLKDKMSDDEINIFLEKNAIDINNYIKTSALKNKNIDLAFELMIDKIDGDNKQTNGQENKLNQSKSISLKKKQHCKDNNEKNKSKCCW